MNQKDLDESLRKSVQAASDKRTQDAMWGLALIIGVPILVLFLFAIGG